MIICKQAFTGILKSASCSLCSVANSVDSDDQNGNEFAPFLNIMNEWYLRDLGRKQKTAIRVKANPASLPPTVPFMATRKCRVISTVGILTRKPLRLSPYFSG